MPRATAASVGCDRRRCDVERYLSFVIAGVVSMCVAVLLATVSGNQAIAIHLIVDQNEPMPFRLSWRRLWLGAAAGRS